MGGRKADYVSFEEKTASLLKLKGYVNIEHNTNICGKQIDVFGEYPTPKGNLKCIVECKKHARKVGINIIEKFAGLISTLDDIDHGFIISENGFTDKAKALAKKSKKIILSTFKEFVNNLIDFENYIESTINDWEKNDLSKYYVTLNGFKYDKNNKKIVYPLLKLMEGWLTDNKKNYLSLLGEYGTGKTSFCQFLKYKAAKDYKSKSSSHLIPIIINLRDYTKVMKIEQLVTDVLINQYELKNANFNTFMKMNEEGLFLLIFDGFDEMAKEVDEDVTFSNFDELSKLINDRNKVILTCRTEFFRNYLKERELLKSSETNIIQFEKRPNFDIVYLELFNDNQIKEYLQKRIPLIPDNDYKWKFYYEKINKIHNLQELAQRPVLIDMIAKSLPQLIAAKKRINSTNLYETYLNGELDREIRKKRRGFLISREDRLTLMTGLARKMFDNNTNYSHFSRISDIIKKFFTGDERRKIEYKSHEFLTCSFLSRDREGNYRFSHTSFMEYFSAISISEEIENNNFNIFKDNEEIPKEIVDFIIGKIGIEACLRLIGTICKDLSVDPIVKKSALSTIHCIEQSNEFLFDEFKDCISEFQLDGVSLPRVDMSGLQLYMANINSVDFSNKVLDNSRFISCNIKEVNLRGASLKNSDFSNSNFEYVDFTRTKFHRSNLKGIHIKNSIMFATNFYEANLTKSILAHIKMKKCNLTNVKLNKADLSYIDISNCLCEGADFSSSTMEKGSLSNSNCKLSRFKNAVLKSANLINSNFEKSDFSYVDLSSANLSHSNFKKSNLRGVNLDDVKIVGTNFDYCDINKKYKSLI